MTAGLGVPTNSHDVTVASSGGASGGDERGAPGAHPTSAATAMQAAKIDLGMGWIEERHSGARLEDNPFRLRDVSATPRTS